MKTKEKSSLRSERRSVIRSLRRFIGWGMKGLCVAVLVYGLAVLLGLIPVNNGFESTPEGIEIFVVSNAVHADIVIPLSTSECNWADDFSPECFPSGQLDESHLAIGWGDKGFFIDTPTWADLKLSTASQALFWPSDTCLHVQACSPADLPVGARSVKLSSAQYQRLVEYIRRSFERDAAGRVIQIEHAHYGQADAFFEAHGIYHCFNTCNCWIGDALQEAGVRTGWFTPMPKTVYWYMPR